MIDVLNPRTGQFDYQIANERNPAVAALATRLRDAQKSWREAGIGYRCEQLSLWRQTIARHADRIGEALCADTGRRAMAHFEVQKILEILDHWLARAPQLLVKKPATPSTAMPSVSARQHLVPYPLVGVISPWNVPLILALIDSIPALLAGSAVLLKPSEVTPRFAAPLADTVQAIEGLRDVFAIVTGDASTGRSVVGNVDAICFTGSVKTGKKVASQAAERFIPAFLELGGKDPAIVLPDADLDASTNAIVRSAIGLSGQACQSLERVYVHKAIFAQTLEQLVSKSKAVTLNWPSLGEGQIGPIIFPPQAEILQRQINDAREKGATIHCGGKIERFGGGHWCLPTVLSDIRSDMLIMQEETFGPLIPVISYDCTDQAIEAANDSIFGLSAAVFGRDTERACRVAEQLRVGAVSVNDASLTAMVTDVEKNSFGHSGLGGSRMGDSGLTRFLRKRAILVQSAEPLPITLFDESGFNHA